MTTRGRLARGEHQQEFEGRVQRWVKQWEPLVLTSKVKVLKWVPTGERPLAATSIQTCSFAATHHRIRLSLLIIDCLLCRRQVRALSSINEYTIQARKPSHSFCIPTCSAMTLAEQRTGFSHTTQQPVLFLSIGNFRCNASLHICTMTLLLAVT